VCCLVPVVIVSAKKRKDKQIDEHDVIILDFIIDKILEFDFAIWSNTLTENAYEDNRDKTNNRKK
jgi:hypothetical protein